jgi:radical SAM superfamily enzyme YgiQ (UPF0313 family)
MPYELPPMRPPSEAYSLLLRVMRGCPWNYCTFCFAYKELSRKDCLRPVEDVLQDIDELRYSVDYWKGLGYDSEPRTAFLADSNAIIIRTDDLVRIVTYLRQVFPALQRVTSYARARTVLAKPRDDLARLQEAGLSRLHLGLESGDDEVLRRVRKGATAQEMIDAGLKVKETGFELSEYVMPGLGGRAASRQHALNTARVLNAINPHYTRVRTLMLAPGTPLRDEYERGEFEPPPRREILEEIGAMVDALEVTGRLCFDHMANHPIFRQDWEGYKLPEEKGAVLSSIRRALGTTES